MLKSITPRVMLQSLILTFCGWIYLYAIIWLANSIWPAGGAR